MASKAKTVFVCSSCGFETLRWNGKCPGCSEWNTMEEQIRAAETSVAKQSASARRLTMERPTVLGDISAAEEDRYKTGMQEFDRVLGGGIVKGSLILLGGDPGIGKSTILLQACEPLGETLSILYVSGEESKRQIKLRANRLGVQSENLFVLTETDIESVIEQMRVMKPGVVMIDSIQTMAFSEISSSPGSVVQVRECTNALMRCAKEMEIPVFVVGHVTKDGNLAGPKTLEHIVDAVLYFEGERQLSYRILRAVKNRYGSTNEIGVFEMRESGLCEVENPSMMLLSGRPKGVSGTCVACLLEGSRPIMAEVQALVTPTGFGNPRRMSTGFDYNRMSLLLAVLEKRGGYFFSNMDAYLNVVGGLRLDEPAADLSVAMAMVSSLKDMVVSEHALAFGEIGLAGEIRSVSQPEVRIHEAARLGFERIVLPRHNLKSLPDPERFGVELIGVRSIKEAVEALL